MESNFVLMNVFRYIVQNPHLMSTLIRHLRLLELPSE
jgi:hypothetical protein